MYCLPFSQRAVFGAILAALLTCFSLSSHANAGKVLFVLGGASIERGQTALAAQRGAQIQAGDTLVTAAAGRMHLRMADGAMISLKPDTRFTVEQYELPAAAQAEAESSDEANSGSQSGGLIGQSRASGGSAVLNLVRGGFRTITGLIGRRDKAAYQLKTPVATIGIRGTDFSVYQCAGNCNSDDGLYLGVWDGGITVQNDGGADDFDAGEFGYVPNSQTRPANAPPNENVTTETPPPPTEDGDDEESEDGDDSSGDQQADANQAQGDTGGEQTDDGDSPDSPSDTTVVDNSAAGDGGFERGGSESSDPPRPPTPPQEVIDDEPEPEPDNRPFRSIAYGEIGDGFVGAATTRNLAVDSDGDLIAFVGAHPANNGASTGDYRIGTATAVNQGLDPDTGIRWGRWADGTATVAIDGGPAQAIDLSNASLHYAFTDATADVPAITRSGSAEFSLVGNTNPTDTLGNVGVLGSASLFANFTQQTVESDVDLLINDQIWSAFGTGSIADGTNLFGGNYESVTVDNDSQGNSGQFSGFFAAPNNAGLPQGAGLIYTLTNGQTDVTGSAVFGDPAPLTESGGQ